MITDSTSQYGVYRFITFQCTVPPLQRNCIAPHIVPACDRSILANLFHPGSADLEIEILGFAHGDRDHQIGTDPRILHIIWGSNVQNRHELRNVRHHYQPHTKALARLALAHRLWTNSHIRRIPLRRKNENLHSQSLLNLAWPRPHFPGRHHIGMGGTFRRHCFKGKWTWTATVSVRCETCLTSCLTWLTKPCKNADFKHSCTWPLGTWRSRSRRLPACTFARACRTWNCKLCRFLCVQSADKTEMLPICLSAVFQLCSQCIHQRKTIPVHSLRFHIRWAHQSLFGAIPVAKAACAHTFGEASELLLFDAWARGYTMLHWNDSQGAFLWRISVKRQAVDQPATRIGRFGSSGGMAQMFQVAPSKLLELQWVHLVAAQPLATAPVAIPGGDSVYLYDLDKNREFLKM